jgi:hypothetical protein
MSLEILKASEYVFLTEEEKLKYVGLWELMYDDLKIKNYVVIDYYIYLNDREFYDKYLLLFDQNKIAEMERLEPEKWLIGIDVNE